MNGPPARIDADDVAAARAANAVLDLQQRLAAEFGPARDDPSGLPGATGPFERMLCEILTSIKWQGEQRKLLEALPHLEPMGSVTMLRTVLARLGVSLIPSSAAARICPRMIFRALSSKGRTIATCLCYGQGATSRRMT